MVDYVRNMKSEFPAAALKGNICGLTSYPTSLIFFYTFEGMDGDGVGGGDGIPSLLLGSKRQKKKQQQQQKKKKTGLGMKNLF